MTQRVDTSICVHLRHMAQRVNDMAQRVNIWHLWHNESTYGTYGTTRQHMAQRVNASGKDWMHAFRVCLRCTHITQRVTCEEYGYANRCANRCANSSVLQCVAVCCSVLHRVVVCCSVLMRHWKSTDRIHERFVHTISVGGWA